MKSLSRHAYGYCYRYYYYGNGGFAMPIVGFTDGLLLDRTAASHLGLPRFYLRIRKDLRCMVVIMKAGFTTDQLESAVKAMEAGGVKVMVSKGSETTILGAEGDASRIDQEKGIHAPPAWIVSCGSASPQEGKSEIPPGQHSDRSGQQRHSGRGSACGHRRALLRGERGQIVGVAESVKQAGAAALRAVPSNPAPHLTPSRGMGNEGIRLLQEAKAAPDCPL